MKKLLFIVIVLLSINYQLFSQTPQTFNYQTVVRDNLGAVIENQNISIRIEVLQTSSSGTSVYSEEHSPTTNQFGLVNLEIGGGTVLSGDFATINWGADIYFIQIELDPLGGTNYQLMGVSQLLTVPYAMYANQAGNVIYSDTSATNELQDWGTLPGIPVDFSDNVDNIDDADADPNNELQTISLSNDTLYMSGGNSIYMSTLSDTSYWEKTGNNIYYDLGNVGVGINNPENKLLVKADSTTGIDESIFAVLNNNGDTVFAVYQEGVRIWVDDNGGTKANGSRGGFAVGGFSPTKAGFTNEYLRVTPDSVRVYINDDYVSAKANSSRGGFAVGGFNPTKGSLSDNYLFVQDDSTRVYTGDTISGFGVENLGSGNSTSYMSLTPNNYFIGHESGDSITTGAYNSFFGYQSGKSTTTALKNTFLGYQSGFSNKTGESNIFIGNKAGYSSTIVSRNILIGEEAGLFNQEGQNVFIGFQAGHQNVWGAANVLIGNNVGSQNASGTFNTMLGTFTGQAYDGSSSTIVGASAAQFAQGWSNCYFGTDAGQSTIGDGNVFIGYASGRLASGGNNVYLGNSSGDNTVGNGNVFIGAGSGGGQDTLDNKLKIENFSSVSPLIYGEFDNDQVVINGALNYGNAVGVNSYAASVPSISTIQEGMSFYIKFANSNTGASTIDINGVGVESIVNSDGSPLLAGQIHTGGIHLIIFDGTNFQLISM